MRFGFSSPYLIVVIAASVLAQVVPPAGEGLSLADGAINSRLVDYWSKSTCYKKADDSEPSMKEQCKQVCFPKAEPDKMQASTCWFGDSKWLHGSSGKPLEEQNKNIPGDALKTGYCGCNDAIILFAGDFFIKAVTEAGKILEKVLCPALQALDIVVELGSIAIPGPGKAIQGGMIAAIRTAKAYKYAYEAQDAAQEWANMIFGGLSLSKDAGCGEVPFSIAKLVSKFLDFANVPDKTLPGGLDYLTLPCPKGGCRGTRQDGQKPDQNGGTPDSDGKKPDQDGKPDNDKPTKSNAPIKSETATSSFRPSATGTTDCKIVGEKDMISTQERRRREEDTLHKRRLAKRAPKRGIACDGVSAQDAKKKGSWLLKSFDYPASGAEAFDALAYGYNTIHSCGDYQWGEARYKDKEYHTEHVLEWSVITGFFGWVDDQYGREDFPHPDPLEKGKGTNFCRYWQLSWDFKNTDAIPDPAPQNKLTSPIKLRKPWDWVAANYPYKLGKSAEAPQEWVEELTLLQIKINSPAKNNMFSDNQIYEDSDMEKLIDRTAPLVKSWAKLEPRDLPSVAIQRLRAVLGVFKYMQDPPVAKIFKDEKTRVGAVLDGIDNTLPNYPVFISGRGTRTFAPWKPVGLGSKWDTYMDFVFQRAKDKGTALMDKNIRRLRVEYMSQAARDKGRDDTNKSNKERNEIREWESFRQEVERNIIRLEAEWNRSKNWVKPW